jgi:nucleotide-binding universal stress UspA family protein
MRERLSEKERSMIKTILVPATGRETDVATFATALHVARSFTAHLDVLHVRLDTTEVAVAMAADIGGGGALAPQLIEQLEREVHEREVNAHRIFSAFCVREGLTVAASPVQGTTRPSTQWHVETGQEPRWLTAYGMTSDLIVVSRGSGNDVTLRSILEAVLLETGRPLLIPGAAAPSAAMFDRIAIGWKPTPEAARAVALAMPLLARAKGIVVMTVAEEERLRDDADRLMRSLAWHGCTVTAERLSPGPHNAVDALLAAASAKAGLLVMGGYGHSRLREWVFGGFTERVLADAPLPVLMAH